MHNCGEVLHDVVIAVYTVGLRRWLALARLLVGKYSTWQSSPTANTFNGEDCSSFHRLNRIELEVKEI